jgi:glutamine cyclotransferase
MRGLRVFLLLIAIVPLGAQTRPAATPPTPIYGYQIVKAFPHDTSSFTQGLIFLDGTLYESVGGEGVSKLRRIQLDSGRVLQEHKVESKHFAEGLTNWGPDLIQLTWKSKVGFVYDRATFKQKRTFTYTGEGWGLTQDGTRLILSDGTSNLRFLNPQTFRETGRVAVRDRGQPVVDLNELEVVRGEIYANVWHTDRIARISPRTGDVTGWIDLLGLAQLAGGGSGEAVLNGIAYDAAGDRLFVTGKLWSLIFEIRVVPRAR